MCGGEALPEKMRNIWRSYSENRRYILGNLRRDVSEEAYEPVELRTLEIVQSHGRIR